MMDVDGDCYVFRLKRNPTTFHRDPNACAPPTEGQTQVNSTITQTARQPLALTAHALNAHTAHTTKSNLSRSALVSKAPPHCIAGNDSACGSLRSKVSGVSSTNPRLDAASHAALRHERAKQNTRTTRSTLDTNTTASFSSRPQDPPRQTVRTLESASSVPRLTPACAQDHLSGGGAAVRRDLGLETHTRQPQPCRANRQHVFLFSAAPRQSPLTAQQIAAAEAACQPPWRSPCPTQDREREGTTHNATHVPLAAFVRGEQCSRGEVGCGNAGANCTSQRHHQEERHIAQHSTTTTTTTSAQMHSLNELYGTNTRLETSVFSSASLDGQGTTAVLLRERHGRAPRAVETTAAGQAVSSAAPHESLSRTRYHQTMAGSGRPW